MSSKQQATMYVVGGGKGGVGKSMTAMAMLDWLLHERKAGHVALIETDDSNPDVFKSYGEVDGITPIVRNLDTEAGWVLLMNEMPEWAKAATQVVVNTAARATPMLTKYLPDLLSGANELGIRVQLIWPINRQHDSLGLLKNVLDALPEIPVIVVRNLYYGSADKFVRFEESKLRHKVRVIDLPDLNDLVADAIYSNRMPLHDGERLKFGERMALKRFRNEAAEQFNLLLE